MAKQKLVYKGREFEIENTIADNKLSKVTIVDAGLEFSFANYEKSAEFLVAEYSGTLEEAMAALVAVDPLTGVEVTGSVAPSTPDKGKGKGKGKGADKKSKEEKEAEKAAKKAEKEANKTAEKDEVKEMTFHLSAGDHTKKVAFKTILKDQAVLETEDIMLDTDTGLHIDRYSAKNRTCILYKAVKEVAPVLEKGKNGENEHEVDLLKNYADVKGEVLIERVSLMDAIYKYAEVSGQTFTQADKYIKIKRGLIAKAEKTPKAEAVTAEDLKAKADTATEAPVDTATEAPVETSTEA